MAKAQVNEVKVIRLVLTEEEALYLKGLMQNPAGNINAEDELARHNEIRTEIFEALSLRTWRGHNAKI